MYRDIPNLYRFGRSVFLVHRHLFHRLEGRVCTLQHPTENSIRSIEMRCRRVGDEELAPIGVLPSISHTHEPSRVMAQCRSNLVLEIPSIDRLPTLALPGWVTALHDEAGDVAMECGPIVIVGSAQGEEILGGLRDGFAKDLELDVAERGVELGEGRIPGQPRFVRLVMQVGLRLTHCH